MSDLSESLKTLHDQITQITEAVGNASQAAEATKPVPQTAEATTPPETPAVTPALERSVRITLELPKSGKTETLMTDENGEAALTRFLQGLRAEWERS